MRKVNNVNRKEVESFEKIEAQLRKIYEEISILSKKKPDDAINEFKLEIINKIIKECNKILKNDEPFKDFENFDKALIPSNSDVVVILSQYIGCFEKVRSENTTEGMVNNFYWLIDNKQSSIRSSPPKQIGYNK